ncbi:hypothetical protein OPKNFCMD_0023 [Methylobacterium crusticola]|uniref:Anti-sigma factor n=1 Tax=Methylobacterium crusticola TaxID=1697972 RepID=A0ABQ4QRS7_9HYPH|nr:hypothetical protein [Methylobacterium crusticola]GJD47317.1 hypothetical protein OPKNFCMD_0023 [Methylobacterium crusticola]
MTTPHDATPDPLRGLAAAGEAALNAALSRLPATEREAYWASVRRCYNAPYNEAAPKARPAGRPAGPDVRRAG